MLVIAKEKRYFVFHCSDGPDVLLERLEREVMQLEDREYLLTKTEGGFRLGIGRGTHNFGFWYCAAVEPDGPGCRISGRVECLDWKGELVEDKQTWLDWIEYALFVLFLLPVIIPFRIYRIFRPEVTMEDRFAEFMTGPVGCRLLGQGERR